MVERSSPKELKTMIKQIYVIILAAALSITTYFAISNNTALKKAIKEKEFYERSIDLQFTQRIEFNEQKLKRSIQQRDSIAFSFDSLSSAYETLLRVDEKKTKELTKIKGMFDKMNSNELSEEMVRQFKEKK